MDDLFKWAKKYSMLEDDVRTTTQQVLVTSQPAKNDSTKGSKTTSQRRQMGKGQDGQQHSNQANLILLNISYEKLLPMICELSDFNWLKPIKMDLAKRDQSIKCAYHKEQSNTKVSTI